MTADTCQEDTLLVAFYVHLNIRVIFQGLLINILTSYCNDY